METKIYISIKLNWCDKRILINNFGKSFVSAKKDTIPLVNKYFSLHDLENDVKNISKIYIDKLLHVFTGNANIFEKDINDYQNQLIK